MAQRLRSVRHKCRRSPRGPGRCHNLPERYTEGPGSADRWPHGTFLAELAGSPEAAKTLLSLGTPRSYEPGEILLAEGLYETFVLLLLSGVTKVTAVTENGDIALLAVRLGGDLVRREASQPSTTGPGLPRSRPQAR